MDNLDPVEGNQDPQPEAKPEAKPQPAPPFSWKDKVGEDLSKAPSLGKFENTPGGLAELSKSYVNLEKMLGHEKVPLPKGPEDTEAISIFNRAIGVPEAPGLYKLSDVSVPGGLEESAFNKSSFAEAMHKHGLTQKQADGLWRDYVGMSNDMYQNHNKQYSDLIDQNINKLRKEWGDTYSSKVELGDMAIRKLAKTNEQADWLMSTLAKHPHGMKWAADVGELLAENKVGDFQYKRFSMSAEEAQNEVARIKNDPNHPYGNPSATEKDHEAAVDHVNRLIAISLGKKI